MVCSCDVAGECPLNCLLCNCDGSCLEGDFDTRDGPLLLLKSVFDCVFRIILGDSINGKSQVVVVVDVWVVDCIIMGNENAPKLLLYMVIGGTQRTHDHWAVDLMQFNMQSIHCALGIFGGDSSDWYLMDLMRINVHKQLVYIHKAYSIDLITD